MDLRTNRMLQEIKMLQNPPSGISAWPKEASNFKLEAVMEGMPDSPYAEGVFHLEINIPPRFPFEPPHVHFTTPIYHPNIDSSGRICLDILKMPPKGSWKPSLNLCGVLSSIRLLMAEPNPDDPLSDEIAKEFKSDYSLFLKNAKQHTNSSTNNTAKRHIESVEEDGKKKQKENTEPECVIIAEHTEMQTVVPKKSFKSFKKKFSK